MKTTHHAILGAPKAAVGDAVLDIQAMGAPAEPELHQVARMPRRLGIGRVAVAEGFDHQPARQIPGEAGGARHHLEGARIEAMAFNAFDTPLGEALEFPGHRPFHLAGRLELNHWNGKTKPQLRLEDASPAG